MGRYREYFALTGDRRCSNAGCSRSSSRVFCTRANASSRTAPAKGRGIGRKYRVFPMTGTARDPSFSGVRVTAAAGRAGFRLFLRPGAGRGCRRAGNARKSRPCLRGVGLIEMLFPERVADGGNGDQPERRADRDEFCAAVAAFDDRNPCGGCRRAVFP